jgi:hypothetical protein
MKSNRKFLAAGAVVIIAVAAMIYIRTPADAPKVVEQTKQGSFLPIPEAPSAPVPASIAVVTATLAASVVPVLTLQQQVDKYISSGKPEDALAAYQIISHCLDVRRDQAHSADRVARGGKPAELVSNACGDLSSSTIAGSSQLADRAAKAGVHGAAAAVLNSEVGGLGEYADPMASGPEVDAYYQRVKDALAAGAANGDCFSLSTMSTNVEGLHDYQGALDYLNRAAKECPKQGKKVILLDQRRAKLTFLINQHR